MSGDEATSGELLDDAQPKKKCRPLFFTNAKRLAEIITGKLEPSRRQFEPEEKRATMGAGSSFLKIAKTHDQKPWELMIQLISGEVLQYTRANPVEEAKLGWELTGNIMVSREIGDREEHPSLAPREGPPQVERARQLRDLQSLRERTCPTARNDLLGHQQPLGRPLTKRCRRNAHSTEQQNQDMTRDSAELQEDVEVGVELEQEQAQEHVV